MENEEELIDFSEYTQRLEAINFGLVINPFSKDFGKYKINEKNNTKFGRFKKGAWNILNMLKNESDDPLKDLINNTIDLIKYTKDKSYDTDENKKKKLIKKSIKSILDDIDDYTTKKIVTESIKILRGESSEKNQILLTEKYNKVIESCKKNKNNWKNLFSIYKELSNDNTKIAIKLFELDIILKDINITNPSTSTDKCFKLIFEELTKKLKEESGGSNK